jgi:hypothetical protein
MSTRKLLPLGILLFFLFACSLPGIGSDISGPTVEPPVPASGTVLFQDDFENPLSGWDKASNPDGIMNYDGGVYRILVDTPKTNFWSTPGKVFTDTRIEVDAAKFGGPDSNRAGIICRFDGAQYYFFVISSDGYFGVGRLLRNADNSSLVTLFNLSQQMERSDYIKTGVAVNHLRADCVGNTLTFFVNGFQVKQVTDAQLTSGRVGLTAGTFAEGGADIIFDKFIVMQP